MELTKNQIIENFNKNFDHWARQIFLPYEYEITCSSCGYNVIKRKHELSKISRKKLIFINRLKYAEHNLFCSCIDVLT